jgi:hypothetical protein
VVGLGIGTGVAAVAADGVVLAAGGDVPAGEEDDSPVAPEEQPEATSITAMPIAVSAEVLLRSRRDAISTPML